MTRFFSVAFFPTQTVVFLWMLLCAAYVALFCFPLPAKAALLPGAAPATARIVYTANTLGQIYPCSSCSGASQGGLARRAAFLAQIAAETQRPLILAGPYEFYADKQSPIAANEALLTPVLHAAFNAMPYSAVYLSPLAARAVHAPNLPPFPKGVPIGDEPVVHFFRAGKLTAACIFLPYGKNEKGAPTPSQVAAFQKIALANKPNASLVVAVSPWGMFAENAMGAALAGHVDILLGSGLGLAVPGQGMDAGGSPGPLWVRPDHRGGSVNVLDIYSLPKPGVAWLEGVHFSSRLVFLEQTLPENATVRAIISAIPKDLE